MNIQIKKGRDGRPTLTCVRADGSRTWGKVHPFLPVHDLTHCSVESVLGFDQAFFGLIASGSAIDDFAEKGAVSRLPPQAVLAEVIVGMFDMERGTGHILTAAELNAHVAQLLAREGRQGFRPITDEEIAAIRALRAELTRRWNAIEAGGTLVVPFPASLAAIADQPEAAPTPAARPVAQAHRKL